MFFIKYALKFNCVCVEQIQLFLRLVKRGTVEVELHTFVTSAVNGSE